MEKDIIPDLAPKLLREKQHLLRKMSQELNDVFCDDKKSTSTTSRRRLSIDSGRGGSVVAEEEEHTAEVLDDVVRCRSHQTVCSFVTDAAEAK
jgi:hypothetical protein